MKILVLGICGAGKSTLSQKLSSSLNLPLIHLDKEYWRPGWSQPSVEEWRERVRELISRPNWIMDGNYGRSIDIRVPAADIIIYVKMNRFKAIYRILKRVIQSYGKVREDMGEGCHERFDFSFIKYTYGFNDKQAKKIKQAIDKFGESAKVIELSSTNDIQNIIDLISQKN